MSTPRDSKNSEKKVAGVLGFFDNSKTLLKAAQQIGAEPGVSFDAFTPFPVHGMDQAQKLKRSPLPFVTFGAGLAGCASGFTLIYWTHAMSWPLVIGGKPFNSWPAAVPVMFECTVLFAGLCTVAAMFFLNGLPNLTKRSFDSSLTRDRFAILIEPPTDSTAAQSLLQKVGAKEIQVVHHQGWFET